MNYGRYFQNVAKSFLTVVNLAVLAISCAIVSILVHYASSAILIPLLIYITYPVRFGSLCVRRRN